jgi:hypothetical protein
MAGVWPYTFLPGCCSPGAAPTSPPGSPKSWPVPVSWARWCWTVSWSPTGPSGRLEFGSVYCTYATVDGHALVGARIWVPAEQLDDPARREELGIGQDGVFKTKPPVGQGHRRGHGSR